MTYCSEAATSDVDCTMLAEVSPPIFFSLVLSMLLDAATVVPSTVVETTSVLDLVSLPVTIVVTEPSELPSGSEAVTSVVDVDSSCSEFGIEVVPPMHIVKII